MSGTKADIEFLEMEAKFSAVQALTCAKGSERRTWWEDRAKRKQAEADKLKGEQCPK